MPRLVAIVPAVAGIIMLVWGFAAFIVEPAACQPGRYESGVSGWAFLGVATTLVASGTGAGVLAYHLGGWLGLVGAALTVAAIALGAELGWIISAELMDCVRGDEGPGLTVTIFAVPSALFGYAIGWILRRANATGADS